MFGAGGLTALAVAVALAAGGGGAAQVAAAAGKSPSERAAALATVASPDRLAAETKFASGKEAAGRAAARSGEVPLPPGEAFDDIQWDNGALSDADIEGLLEFNAACKWWIADADAPTKETARVVATIQSWPTMRGGDRHDAALAVAGRDPELAKQLLAFCRASV